MLRRQAILDRNDDRFALGGEGINVWVVERGEGGLYRERAAVDVDQDGELDRRLGGFGEVEPDGEVFLRRDDDVLRNDAGLGVGRRGKEVVLLVAVDFAGGVDAEERREVVEYSSGFGIHFSANLSDNF